MKNPALVLVDLQNDFLTLPRLEPHPDTVVAGAARLVEEFRRKGLPVVHVRTKTESDGSGRMPHWEQKGLFACVKGSQGYDAPPSLEACSTEPVFDKTFFSAFSVPAFEDYLRERKIETLILGGLYLQTCIRQTALDAYLKGFQVRIAREAVGSHDPLHGALTLDYLADRAIPSLATAGLLAGEEAVAEAVFFAFRAKAKRQGSGVVHAPSADRLGQGTHGEPDRQIACTGRTPGGGEGTFGQSYCGPSQKAHCVRPGRG